jgi:hypothetical protein
MDRYDIATNKTPPPDTRSPLDKELWDKNTDLKTAIKEKNLSIEAVSQILGYNQEERNIYDRTFRMAGTPRPENISFDPESYGTQEELISTTSTTPAPTNQGSEEETEIEEYTRVNVPILTAMQPNRNRDIYGGVQRVTQQAPMPDIPQKEKKPRNLRYKLIKKSAKKKKTKKKKSE